MIRRVIPAVLVAFAWLVAPVVASVPDPGGSIFDSDASSEPSIDRDVAAGVTITVDPRAGVGGFVRAGDWFGLRVDVSDAGSTSRNVLVRLVGYDPDGDVALYERAVATPNSVWLYGRLPFRAVTGDPVVVEVYEARDGGDAWTRYVPGRLLGRTTTRLGPVAPARQSAIGVIGPDDLGLAAYGGATIGGMRQGFEPWAHEPMSVVTGIQVTGRGGTGSSLPDRWHGLGSLDVMVWGTSGAEVYSPLALSASPSRVRAIEEWVERGGHLVIVLEASAQVWIGNARNPLAGLLPPLVPAEARAVRAEDGLDALLRDAGDPALPSTLLLRPLVAVAGAGVGEATPILATGDGTVIAMRRNIGVGCVTVVGVSIGSLPGDLPRAMRFWNRVLGMRGEVLSSAEVSARMTPAAGGAELPRERDETWFDTDIGARINLTGEATVGVLLAVLIFGLYWVVAGPGGFGVLDRLGWRRHAWLAFLGAIGAFTGLSWGAATLFGDRSLGGRYVAFLDAVEGEPVRRARAWATVVLPGYGMAEVSLSGVGEPDDRRTQLVSAWHPLEREPDGRATFPNTRRYRIGAHQPGLIRIPARSTARMFRLDWAGTAEESEASSGVSAWSMPRAVPEPGRRADESVRFAPSGPDGGAGESVLEGVLVHELPGAIVDGRLIVVEGQLAGTEAGPGRRSVARGRVYALANGRWDPRVPLDLSRATPARVVPGTPRAWTSLAEFFQSEMPGWGVRPTGDSARTRTNRAVALSMFRQFPPPTESSRRLMLRRNTHGLSLDRWMTQPCVMVIGRLETGRGDGLPVPLTVGGRSVPMSGETIVRWVSPLPGRPAAPVVGGVVEGEDG